MKTRVLLIFYAIQGLIKGNLCLTFNLLTFCTISFLMCNCAAVRPPEKLIPPQGDGWITYNQAYNFTSASVEVSSNYESTTTNKNWYSEVKPNEGTPLVSSETPKTQGCPQIQKCSYIFTKGGNK